MYILNGFKFGDKACDFTNISNHGCSVVDYCAVSDDFIDNIVRFCVCERIEFQHMPLLFEISAAMPTYSASSPVLSEKLLWQKDKAEDLLCRVNSVSFKDKLAISTNSIDECIDRALREFTGSIF